MEFQSNKLEEQWKLFSGSRQVTKFTNNGKEYSIVLQGDLKDRTEPSNLNKVYVRSDITKKLIPLSNVIKISESAAAPFLSRYQRQKAVTISARLVGDYTIGEALEYLNNIVKEKLPAEVRVDYKGV